MFVITLRNLETIIFGATSGIRELVNNDTVVAWAMILVGVSLPATMVSSWVPAERSKCFLDPFPLQVITKY